jgi:hypothetical protein
VIFGASSAGFVSVFLSAVCVVMIIPFLIVDDVMNASIQTLIKSIILKK